jgi:hypothetical protein
MIKINWWDSMMLMEAVFHPDEFALNGSQQTIK